jgi:hypothetical protein
MWKSIPGFSKYEISSTGQVRRAFYDVAIYKGMAGNRLKPLAKLKLQRHINGYLCVSLIDDNGKIKTMLPHQMVAVAFHGPKPSPQHQAIHWDDNKQNNWYKNIRWGTQVDNEADKHRNGNSLEGIKNLNAKLTVAQVKEMRRLFNEGLSRDTLAAKYKIHKTTVCRVINGARYKGV